MAQLQTTGITGSLTASSNITTSGDLAVNGGNITSTANILNISSGDTINFANNLKITGSISASSTIRTSGGIIANGTAFSTTSTTFGLLDENVTILNLGGDVATHNLSTNYVGAPNFILHSSGNAQYRVRNRSETLVDNADIGSFNVFGVTSSNPGSGLSTRGGMRVRWDGTSGGGKTAILASTPTTLYTPLIVHKSGIIVSDNIEQNGSYVNTGYTVKTTNHSFSLSDHTVYFVTGSVTGTLPDASSVAGVEYVIKKGTNCRLLLTASVGDDFDFSNTGSIQLNTLGAAYIVKIKSMNAGSNYSWVILQVNDVGGSFLPV
jgi:hypothetical protein